jgi:hypothetical protein
LCGRLLTRELTTSPEREDEPDKQREAAPTRPRTVPQTIVPLHEITTMIVRNRGNIQLGGGAVTYSV